MTKFKFGDKVWHEKYGIGVITSNRDDDCDNTHISAAFKDYRGSEYSEYVAIESLTPATDWVKCSERMPDIDVEVLVYFDGYIYIDSLYYDKNLKEYWWQGNDRLPTHWMPLPNKL